MKNILFIVIYITFVMPLCELFVDWLEYKFRSNIYIASKCTNFCDYRKYKQSLFGRIKKDE